MDALQKIDSLVNSNTIVLFLKGSPERPTCEHSALASKYMTECDCDYLAVNIQDDPVVRATLPKYKGCATFPQLFVQGQLIGGSDVIQELFESAELCPMLREVSRPMKVAI